MLTTLEIDEIPTVELMMIFDDAIFKKVMVPMHDWQSLEQALYCYHEFLGAAQKPCLDGAEWCNYHCDTLRGHEADGECLQVICIIVRNKCAQCSECARCL